MPKSLIHVQLIQYGVVDVVQTFDVQAACAGGMLAQSIHQRLRHVRKPRASLKFSPLSESVMRS